MGMDIFGKQPRDVRGKYFRADIWSWRVIHLLCDKAIVAADLPFSTQEWARNNGDGLAVQEHCDLLANALEGYLEQHPPNLQGVYAYELGSLLERGPAFSTDGPQCGPAPNHQAHIDHVRGWIGFLRSCGGFEIR